MKIGIVTSLVTVALFAMSAEATPLIPLTPIVPLLKPLPIPKLLPIPKRTKIPVPYPIVVPVFIPISKEIIAAVLETGAAAVAGYVNYIDTIVKIFINFTEAFTIGDSGAISDLLKGAQEALATFGSNVISIATTGIGSIPLLPPIPGFNDDSIDIIKFLLPKSRISIEKTVDIASDVIS